MSDKNAESPPERSQYAPNLSHEAAISITRMEYEALQAEKRMNLQLAFGTTSFAIPATFVALISVDVSRSEKSALVLWGLMAGQLLIMTVALHMTLLAMHIGAFIGVIEKRIERIAGNTDVKAGAKSYKSHRLLRYESRGVTYNTSMPTRADTAVIALCSNSLYILFIVVLSVEGYAASRFATGSALFRHAKVSQEGCIQAIDVAFCLLAIVFWLAPLI